MAKSISWSSRFGNIGVRSRRGIDRGAAWSGTGVQFSRSCTGMWRSQALANDRCAASCEAAKLRRERTGLTGRLRCISVVHGCNSKDSYGRTAGTRPTIANRFASRRSPCRSCRQVDRCHNAARCSAATRTMAIGLLLGVAVMMAAFAGIVIFGRKRGLL